jgi:hypothetical protein
VAEAHETSRDQLDGLFVSLEAGYEAILSREEDAAASDLALSLLQDRDLASALANSGPIGLRRDGVAIPVIALGRDYVVLGDRGRSIIPLSSCGAFETCSGNEPAGVDGRFTQVMRTFVRDRAVVRIGTPLGMIEGVAMSAGRDHVIVRTDQKLAIVSYSKISVVTCDRGGRADAI